MKKVKENRCSKPGKAFDIYEFIKKLRLSHFIDSKQLRFIENIGFYISDLVVYKIVVAHTHTVCVPYYKAAPYNISHTKKFSRAKYNIVI